MLPTKQFLSKLLTRQAALIWIAFCSAACFADGVFQSDTKAEQVKIDLPPKMPLDWLAWHIAHFDRPLAFEYLGSVETTVADSNDKLQVALHIEEGSFMSSEDAFQSHWLHFWGASRSSPSDITSVGLFFSEGKAHIWQNTGVLYRRILEINHLTEDQTNEFSKGVLQLAEQVKQMSFFGLPFDIPSKVVKTDNKIVITSKHRLRRSVDQIAVSVIEATEKNLTLIHNVGRLERWRTKIEFSETPSKMLYPSGFTVERLQDSASEEIRNISFTKWEEAPQTVRETSMASYQTAKSKIPVVDFSEQTVTVSSPPGFQRIDNTHHERTATIRWIFFSICLAITATSIYLVRRTKE